MDSFEVVKKWVAWSEVFISMIIVQVFATGMQLLSKVILSQGTFIFALLTYRHLVAALCVSPFAFFFERGLSKKYTWSLLFWLFINALTGMTGAMGLYYYGLRDTTATYAINFLNLIPIFTFLFSIILRIEKLKLDTTEGKFKILGAILCVGGALTTSLYKGKDIIHFGHPKIHQNSSSTITVNISQRHHYTRGTFMLVGSVMCYASWYMVQVKLQKIFPFKFTSTMLTCIVTSLQSAVIGLCIDTSKASWTLGWNLQLITIVYSGALATAATFCLITRVIPKRGPTYPPMFNPLALIFTSFFEALIFGQVITLGSLLGSFFIIVGLYAFLWAKKKEYKKFQAQVQAQAQANEQVTVVSDEDLSRVNSTIIPTYSLEDHSSTVADNAKP